MVQKENLRKRKNLRKSKDFSEKLKYSSQCIVACVLVQKKVSLFFTFLSELSLFINYVN